MTTVNVHRLSGDEVSDFRDLVGIFNDVFDVEEPIPGSEHLSTLLANPDFLVFVVREGHEIVGGLTIYVLHSYYGTRPAAYVYDVGITPGRQGQGLGKRLMAEVRNYCEQRGFDELYVDAERADADVVEFYRKTNPSSEMSTVQFTYALGSDQATGQP